MSSLNMLGAEETPAPKISAHPDEVRTHFVLVAPCNKKGQGRYRCITCNHEFASTGKIRLAQHIVGLDDVGSNFKNVRACPKPYPPLKQALLELRQRHEELSSADILANLRTIDHVSSENSSTDSVHKKLSASTESQFSVKPELIAPFTTLQPKRPTNGLETMTAAYMIATAAPTELAIRPERMNSTTEDDYERQESIDEGTEKKAPVVIPAEESDEAKAVRESVVAPAPEVPTKRQALEALRKTSTKRRKVNNTEGSYQSSAPAAASSSAAPGGNLSAERLLSIFQLIHQISPQALQLAVFLEGMKEQQQRGSAPIGNAFNPMEIAKAISSLQNPVNPFATTQSFYNYPTPPGTGMTSNPAYPSSGFYPFANPASFVSPSMYSSSQTPPAQENPTPTSTPDFARLLLQMQSLSQFPASTTEK